MLLEKFRQEIIETTRCMLSQGLVLSSWGNVSIRPGPEEVLIITPSGMDYNRIHSSDMVVLDFFGEVLQGDRKPSSEFRLHCEVYRSRPDIKALVHTHSSYASSFAAARTKIPVVTEELAQVNGGPVEVAEYFLPGTRELAESCILALGKRNAVLLANHGLVGAASSLEEALKVCLVVEKTARIALQAMNLGPITEIGPEEIVKIREFYLKSYGQR